MIDETLDILDIVDAAGGPETGPRLRPALRRRGFVGVDIGLKWTKIAQAELVGGVTRVRAVDAFETNAMETPAGFELPGEFGKQLTYRLGAGDFKGSEAACLLPAKYYEHYQIPLTDADRNGTPGGLRERIAAELPPSWDRSLFDFRTLPGELLGEAKSAGRADVLTLRRGLVDEVVEHLFRAGVDVQYLDAPGEAAARAVELDFDVAPLDTVTVVDWGFAETTLTVVNAGAPVFSRRLRETGYTEVLRAVAEGLAISEPEAASVLESYGLGNSPLAREIATHIGGAHRRLQDELEKTLAYFRRKHFRLSPEQLLLTGDGAAMRGGHLLWNNTLGISPRIWNAADVFRARPPRFRRPVYARAFALSALAFQS